MRFFCYKKFIKKISFFFNCKYIYIFYTLFIHFSYYKQAIADAESVWRRTLQLLRQLGKSSDSISERDVKLFCRHASNIHVEKGTCIADEYDSKTFDTSDIGKMFINEILLNCYRKFFFVL